MSLGILQTPPESTTREKELSGLLIRGRVLFDLLIEGPLALNVDYAAKISAWQDRAEAAEKVSRDIAHARAMLSASSTSDVDEHEEALATNFAEMLCDELALPIDTDILDDLDLELTDSLMERHHLEPVS